MAEPVRFGLVGAGRVGTDHMKAAAQVPEVEFVGVCDAVRDRGEALGDTNGVPVFSSLADLAEGSAAEAVLVAVPTGAHAKVAVAAAERGLHVLVEKPMATTIEDCDAMIQAGRAAGVVVGVCHIMQHHFARLSAAKRVIDSCALGVIVMMNSRRTTHYRIPSRPEWMYDSVMAGGGVMFNLGTYAIEEFQWLSGASVRRVVGFTPDSKAVETQGAALLELDNGVHASIVELDTHYPATEEMDIVLTRGALRLSAAEGLWQYTDGTGTQLVQPSDPPRADYYQALSCQLAEFARALRHRRKPEVDGAWGRSVVAAAAAVYESAKPTSRSLSNTTEGPGPGLHPTPRCDRGAARCPAYPVLTDSASRSTVTRCHPNLT